MAREYTRCFFMYLQRKIMENIPCGDHQEFHWLVYPTDIHHGNVDQQWSRRFVYEDPLHWTISLNLKSLEEKGEYFSNL